MKIITVALCIILGILAIVLSYGSYMEYKYQDLYHSIQADDVMAVRHYAKKGPSTVNEPTTIHYADNTTISASPLHYALLRGNPKIVKLLLDNGANVNAQDKRGKTPLFCACSSGMKDIAELLIAKGGNVNIKTADGYTPLIGACSCGNMDIVLLLLSKGVDMNSRDNKGLSPMNWAHGKGHMDIYQFLRGRGAL